MRSFERKELAEKLWYMDRDINHAENPKTYMSIVRDLRGGFPDDTAKLMVYLSEPESYKAIMEQLYEWRDAYRENPDIMRFRHYHPDRVVPFLEEYAYPRKEYTSFPTLNADRHWNGSAHRHQESGAMLHIHAAGKNPGCS